MIGYLPAAQSSLWFSNSFMRTHLSTQCGWPFSPAWALGRPWPWCLSLAWGRN